MPVIASSVFAQPSRPAFVAKAPLTGAAVIEKMKALKARKVMLTTRGYRREWFKLRKLLASTREWRDLRLAASNRAAMWCEKRCGRYGSQVHHVKTVHSRLDLVFDLDNVLWICQDCHKGCHQ